MARPTLHSKSRIGYLRQRIPRDLLKKVRGLSISFPASAGGGTVNVRGEQVKVSLRTSDHAAIRERHAAAQSHLEKVWAALRAGPRRLSQKEATALAGELYRVFAASEDDPGSPELWEGVRQMNADATQGKYSKLVIPVKGGESAEEVRRRRSVMMERRFGSFATGLLTSKALFVDAESRLRLLDEIEKALTQSAEKLKRNAEGDFTPDPKANRFPTWPVSSESARSASGASLTGLVESWWAEAKAAGRKISTRESYKATVTALAAFLKHDDAARVTKLDVAAFKDHRLKHVSAKTVKDSDLAALKTIFGWAVANDRLTANPAAGVTLKVGKKRKLREPGFTDEEAAAILSKASNHRRGNESAKLFAAKRWLPWLCAYSGARIGEVGQLRKQDITKKDGVWVMNLTPDAGTIKNNEAREVVLHPHVIELGFIDFVEKSAGGHLFIEVEKKAASKEEDVRGPLRTLKNRLAEFVRSVVADQEILPNHAWRHRFKAVGLEHDIQHRVLDAIQGQQPRNVSETYGHVSLKTQANAIAKFPRYKVASR